MTPTSWGCLSSVQTTGLGSTHQDVLQLDVSVQQTLAVQEADALHHVQSHLEPLLQRQTSLGGESRR